MGVQIFILTSQFPLNVLKIFMPLIAHFAKKGISRFVDKIIHSNTKYLGVWGQSYIVVIDRSFQHGKGKSAWEFSLLKSFLC